MRPFFILAFILLASCSAPEKPAPMSPEEAALLVDVGPKWPENHVAAQFTAVGRKAVRVAWGDNAIVVPKSARTQVTLSPTDKTWSTQIDAWRAVSLAATWPLSKTTTARHPLLVFVSPNCQLCEHWLTHWPKDIPVVWVPVWSTPTRPRLITPDEAAWLRQWCPSTPTAFPPVPTPTKALPAVWLACVDQLRAQHQRAHDLGAEAFPVVLSSDGRRLTGWPDAAWLARWWNPSAPIALAHTVVDEPDL